MTSEYKKEFLLNTLYFGCVIILIALISRFLFAYLFPFLVGGIIAFTVQKPANFLHKKSGIKKSSWAVMLTVIICVAVISAVLLSVWALGERLIGYIEKMPQMISGFQDTVDKIEQNLTGRMKMLSSAQKTGVERAVGDAVDSFLGRFSAYISNAVAGAVKSLPYLLISGIVTIVASCYIAKDYDRLKGFFSGFVSPEKIKTIRDIKSILTDNCRKFIKGYGILAAITFLELCLAFALIGIEKPVLKALLVSLVDALPVLGIGTVVIPWAIIELLKNDLYTGFGLLLAYAVIVIVHNFIEPRIIGEQIGINPIFTLIAIFLGLKIAGIAGVILFPLALTVMFEYYRRGIRSE